MNLSCRFVVTASSFAALACLALAGCSKTADAPVSAASGATLAASSPAKAASGSSPPVSVTTVKARKRDMAVNLKATGTVVPLTVVDVKAQVTSTVRQVHFKEGQFVKVGQLLFTLDARTEEANLAKAQAQLAKDKVSLADARRQLERAKQLLAQNFVSQVAVDTAQTQVESWGATLTADEAAVSAAKVALSYSRISAPHSGRAGAVAVFAGSAVLANQTTLVTVTQLDPIGVAFSVPQRDISSALDALKDGGAQVSATLADGGGSFKGRLRFMDNAVDASSGTIKAKAVFANPESKLWPGAFVEVAQTVNTLKEVVVLPPMNLSEHFIRRPVMTVLLNVAIVLAGFFAIRSIPVAALPSYDTAVINVSAAFPGASPETMATSVALPLEKQFQTIAGLSVISSTSLLGSTSLTLEFEEGRNIDGAALDVQAALLRAQRSLPQDMTQLPAYRKVNPADAPILLVSLTSPSMPFTDLQDYAEHLISPTLSTIEGVAQINIFGAKRFAVRVRVLPEALAARNLSMEELASALRAANVNTPLGTLEGNRQLLTLQANQQLRAAAEFAELIVANRNGTAVRLKDVASVEDSVETIRSYANLNGDPSITLAVLRQPGANTVRVVDAVRAALPRLKDQMPQSINMTAINDRSVSVREALHDVSLTLLGTIVLVVLVIFLFLRRFVATAIPVLSLPVSLMGAVALLWGMQYSLDNVSLLGLTLAVGLVVDDAIVMLENIMRHVENGENPFAAALAWRARSGFHHHLHFHIADRRFYPDLFYAGCHWPAVS
jgi:RND family efflux transporter MFP subunit